MMNNQDQTRFGGGNGKDLGPRSSFHANLELLEEDLSRLGVMAEESLAKAVTALKTHDPDMAQQVIDYDDAIDDLTLELEERCLSIIALQQPMASDLRRIGTVLKIVTDLERVADHAVDISEVALRLAGQTYIKPLIDIPRMARIAQDMLRKSLEAFRDRDITDLETLIEMDDEVDNLFAQVFRELLVFMMSDPKTIQQSTEFLMVASHLERVADHATNIGEWVIYSITGERKDLNP
ncbi:MAG TPA: phosphate signaling complex protein PhoU [Bacillota bacterium]|nr:phosphate signaling complex protein PhoU [Bacillota bacterium]